MQKLSTPVNTVVFSPTKYYCIIIAFFFIILQPELQAQSGSPRTHTQAEWGTVPKGNNTAAYMHRKFREAFPNGLTVGCTNKMLLSNPAAITDFLPSKGNISVLPSGIQTNPGASYSNSLIGHIVALKLNIGFDEYDAGFSNSIFLKNLVIKTGVFAGKTVQQILQEAENAVGGCPSPYLLSDLNDAIAKINQNYDNSTIDMGFLASSMTTASGCIKDTEAPVFKEMPQTFTVFAEECYIASWNMPIITDNCSAVTLTSNINLGECLPIGIHKVTMTAKDASGNQSHYSFTITIEEAVYMIPLTTSKNNVELVVHSTQNSVNLDWLNKDNEKISHFIIQKANDFEEFMDIDSLAANLSSGIQQYFYIDNKPKKDENSYRLKIIFKDRTIQYSKARTANYKYKDLVQVYPSPSTETVNLDLYPYLNQSVQILLYDYLGQPVYKQFIQQATDKPVKIETLDLPDGQYILSIIPQNHREIVKMLFIGNQ